MAIDFQPESKIDFQPEPASYLLSLQAAKSPGDLYAQAIGGPGVKDMYRGLTNMVFPVGEAINRGNQQLGQVLQTGLGNPKNPSPMPGIAQMAGKAYQKVSPFLNPVPTNDLGMVAAPFMAAEAGGALARRAAGVGSVADSLKFGAEGFGAATEESPVLKSAAEKLTKANVLQKTIANALSAANRVKPSQLAAVIANPEILSDATPGTAEVSKAYENAFAKAGMEITDARYKYLTGLTRPLRDQQLSKAEKIVDMALDPTNPAKLRQGLTDSEAYVARTASSKLERSVVASSNPAYKAAAEKQTAMLDDFLESSSLPQIRMLSRAWFRAVTKEAMLEPLPLNKQGTPNALSTLLMAAQMKSAVAKAFPGAGQASNYSGAAMDLAGAAAMSPYLGGKAILGTSSLTPGASGMLGANLGGPDGQ